MVICKGLEIIKKEANGALDEKTMEALSKNEGLAPAVVAKTLSVLGKIKHEIEKPSEIAYMMMDNMLKAQGRKGLEDSNVNSLPLFYDPTLVNANIDLRELAAGIESAKSARICLYGVSGTGKSAYGRWLSEYLNKPLILKKGSDLLSKWVGGTEKNIKMAFEEAKDEGAVLVFDEVDSFLADRKNARVGWEITQVNEMLTQMENFNGVFLATTNLMENLDEACIRRFDAKVEFGYLKSVQSTNLFKKCTKELGVKITTDAKDSIKALSNLALGDFATVMRQHRFNKIKKASDFVERLRAETALKKDIGSPKMGFLA